MFCDSLRRRPLWPGLLVGLALLIAAVPGSAQTTYSYQGNNYDTFEPVMGSVFTSAMSISGSFEITLPLPPNLPLTGIDTPQLISFEFTNGLHTFTPTNTVRCRFQVATGPSGEIVRWNIFLREAGVLVGNDQQTLSTLREVGAYDQGDFIAADADPCLELASSIEAGYVTDSPGVWTSDALPAAPSLPAWGALLLLALLAAAGVLTLRGRQRA